MDKMNNNANANAMATMSATDTPDLWVHPQAIELYSGDRSQWHYDIYAKMVLDDVFGRESIPPAELAWAAWIICGMRADAIISSYRLPERLANELQTLLFFGPEIQRRWLARNRFEAPALPAWMLPGNRQRPLGDSPKDNALRNAAAEDDFCRAWLSLHGADGTSTRVSDREVQDWLTESNFFF